MLYIIYCNYHHHHHRCYYHHRILQYNIPIYNNLFFSSNVSLLITNYITLRLVINLGVKYFSH